MSFPGCCRHERVLGPVTQTSQLTRLGEDKPKAASDVANTDTTHLA